VASKRKQKDMKQEAPFQLEEFDEKEYLEEQLRIGKGVFISMAWAVVVGAATFFVFNMFQDNWKYIFIPGFFGMLALYVILPKFAVDLSVIPKKSWFNFVFSFGLTWLAVVVLSLNPPFSDFSDPSLDDLTLDIQEYNIAMYDNSTPTVQIRAEIRDNYKVSNGKVSISYPESGFMDQTADLQKEDGTENIYYYNLPKEDVIKIMDAKLKVDYTITAEDSRGNKVEATSSFEILGSDSPQFHEDTLKQSELNITQVNKQKGIQIILGDNATFKEVYFTIDDVPDERYYFERGKALDDDKKYYYNYFATTEDLEKDEYSITVTAVDAGNNVITKDFDFILTEDGANLDEGGSGLMPGFGIVEVIGILLISLVFIKYIKKK